MALISDINKVMIIQMMNHVFGIHLKFGLENIVRMITVRNTVCDHLEPCCDSLCNFHLVCHHFQVFECSVDIDLCVNHWVSFYVVLEENYKINLNIDNIGNISVVINNVCRLIRIFFYLDNLSLEIV